MSNVNYAVPADSFHVAIIMDGNGRWAARQGKPRFVGHQTGADRVREIVETAADLNISTLTLFAFSSDNWRRPKFEVNFLMTLLKSYLRSEISTCLENGIRLSIIGRRDRLDSKLVKAIDHAEKETSSGQTLHLRVAVDYSSRDAILQTFQKFSETTQVSRETFSRFLAGSSFPHLSSPDVDLLIRTGGEQRLSDFLLWECAYAELYFSPLMWPEFTTADLKKAVQDFRKRERRFGQIPQASAI